MAKKSLLITSVLLLAITIKSKLTNKITLSEDGKMNKRRETHASYSFLKRER